MTPIHQRLLPALGTCLLLLGLASSAPHTAHARDCSGLSAELSQDLFQSGEFEILKSEKLYRRQDRPWAFIPTGSRVLLRAPAGVTEADLHRAATCNVSEQSPLGVPGAKISVLRTGALYELRITAEQRAAALEIQQRVAALTSGG